VRVPSIVFTKGGGLWLEDIAAIGCDAVGLDWTVNLGQARARIGSRVALQGNLDPMVLMADPGQIQGEAIKTLESYGVPQDGHGHIFNLGHGISQYTPPESVTALVEAVHRYSREQRRRGASASTL
jgi:uroporphyrinogen decarboxylase